jgi:hypothetical protein
MEYLDPTLPPVRSLMMLSSGGRGVSWLARQYYVGSTAVLALIALAATVWYFTGVPTVLAGVLVGAAGLAAVCIPVIIHILGTERRTLSDLTGTYDDAAFAGIVRNGTFGDVVRKYHG